MRPRKEGKAFAAQATPEQAWGFTEWATELAKEAMALELAPTVAVFALAPDLIADNEEMPPDFVARAVAATPMARLVTRAEVAEMVGLLCTPACDMLTGQTVVMDGGRSIPRMAGSG